MKYLIIILLLTISFVYTIDLPTLYYVQNAPFSLFAVDIQSGNTIQDNPTPGDLFIGLANPTSTGVQVFVQENNFINVYNYTISSNSYDLVVKNFKTPGLDNAGVEYQQFGQQLNSLDSYYIVGSTNYSSISIFSFDLLEKNSFIETVLGSFDILYGFYPSGCYDPIDLFYYIYYVDSNTQDQIVLKYSIESKSIINKQKVQDFSTSIAVNLFYANNNAYAVQFLGVDGFFYLFEINPTTLEPKLVCQVKSFDTADSSNGILFAANDQYIVFQAGGSDSIHYVVVDLTTYKPIYTSTPSENLGYYIWYMALSQ